MCWLIFLCPPTPLPLKRIFAKSPHFFLLPIAIHLPTTTAHHHQAYPTLQWPFPSTVDSWARPELLWGGEEAHPISICSSSLDQAKSWILSRSPNLLFWGEHWGLRELLILSYIFLLLLINCDFLQPNGKGLYFILCKSCYVYKILNFFQVVPQWQSSLILILRPQVKNDFRSFWNK